MNGPSTSRSAWSTTGMLTAFVTMPPSSAATTCSATITPARSCASSVDAARCGVTTTWSSSSSGPEYGSAGEDVERRAGELARADRLGQRVLVDERAARGVDEPRAVPHQRDRVAVDQAARLVGERRVQRHEVGRGEQLLERLRLLDAELAEPLAPDEGVVRDDVHRRGRSRGGRPAGRSGRSRSRRASCPPSSIPLQRERSQRPCLSAACACGMLRASATIRPIVCSAAETTVDSGAFATTIPRRVAASTSTLSTPTPARPITFRLRRALDQLAVSFVAERITIAS